MTREFLTKDFLVLGKGLKMTSQIMKDKAVVNVIRIRATTDKQNTYRQFLKII